MWHTVTVPWRVVSLLCVSYILILTGPTDGQLTVDLPPESTVTELGSICINCTVYNDLDALVSFRWTSLLDPEFELLQRELCLSQVTINMAGPYKCEALITDPIYELAEDVMELIVHYTPRWDAEVVPKYAVAMGQPGSIRCVIKALPTAEFYWQDKGLNMTSSGVDYTIESVGNVSTISFTSVTSSRHASYLCNAENYVGRGAFTVTLQPPGLPDGPAHCQQENVTHDSALLTCQPGFDGGGELDFMVYKRESWTESEETPSSFVWQGSLALITVGGLKPRSNYTLLVYQSNEYGRSEDAFGIYTWTPEGPPSADEPFPMELAAIIGGVVGGAILVVIVIVISVVCCRRKEKAKATQTPKTVTKAASSYMTGEGGSSGTVTPNMTPPPPGRYAAERQSKNSLLGSFRLRRTPRASGGFNNPAYTGDPGAASRGPPRGGPGSGPLGGATHDGYATPYQDDRQVSNEYSPNPRRNSFKPDGGHNLNANSAPKPNRAGPDMTSRDRYPSNSGPYVISLGPEPGESSDVTYENHAYSKDDSVEIKYTNAGVGHRDPNIPSNPAPEVVYRRRMADPVQRASSQVEDQPGLAGYGALAQLPGPGSGNRGNPNFGGATAEPPSPAVRKEVRLAVRPPSFEPEVPWEFARQQLYVRMKIGEGSFGEVWRARAEGILGRPGMVPVAVKMLKDRATPEERRALVKELEIMKLLQPHPNIISLLGCCTKTEPLCIILEFASEGSLQELLRMQRLAFELNDLNNSRSDKSQGRRLNLTLRDLTRFALQVASGMEYVSSMELLHRDLAARNVLVDEKMVCKICDFGSARDIIQMRQYESKTQHRLPIRWMAPESLFQCTYSTQSDVWSFGVLLWEIITLGSSPYPGMSGPEVMQYVQKGCRMPRPNLCNNALYTVMKDCWNQFQPKRPSFSLLCHRLAALVDDSSNQIFVDQMEDNAYDIITDVPGEKC